MKASAQHHLPIRQRDDEFGSLNRQALYFDIRSENANKAAHRVAQPSGHIGKKEIYEKVKSLNEILRMLNNSQNIANLRIPPSNRPEKLSGNLSEFYSIRINDQWRIIFQWENGQASEVEIIDYGKFTEHSSRRGATGRISNSYGYFCIQIIQRYWYSTNQN